MAFFDRSRRPRSTDLAADAGLAADLVREAAELAAQMRADGLRAQQKTAVADVVTAADHAAERLIGDHLAMMRPEDGVFGEEGLRLDGTSGRTWVVDPVDGTYNFVHGQDWWCSALALVESGMPDDRYAVPALGAVHHAASGTLYLGGPDLPSTRNGEPLAPLPDVRLAETCVATYLHPPLHAGPIGETFRHVVAHAATVRMLGSGSMDMAAIASGHFGLYLHQSVPAWDWLPGAALITGAGGMAVRTTAGGVEWSIAGAPTAVSEALALLGDR